METYNDLERMYFNRHSNIKSFLNKETITQKIKKDLNETIGLERDLWLNCLLFSSQIDLKGYFERWESKKDEQISNLDIFLFIVDRTICEFYNKIPNSIDKCFNLKDLRINNNCQAIDKHIKSVIEFSTNSDFRGVVPIMPDLETATIYGCCDLSNLKFSTKLKDLKIMQGQSVKFKKEIFERNPLCKLTPLTPFEESKFDLKDCKDLKKLFFYGCYFGDGSSLNFLEDLKLDTLTFSHCEVDQFSENFLKYKVKKLTINQPTQYSKILINQLRDLKKKKKVEITSKTW